MAMVGALIVAQVLTLITTPVTHLYMDRFNHFATTHLRGKRTRRRGSPMRVEARRSSKPVILKNVR